MKRGRAEADAEPQDTTKEEALDELKRAHAQEDDEDHTEMTKMLTHWYEEEIKFFQKMMKELNTFESDIFASRGRKHPEISSTIAAETEYLEAETNKLQGWLQKNGVWEDEEKLEEDRQKRMRAENGAAATSLVAPSPAITTGGGESLSPAKEA